MAVRLTWQDAAKDDLRSLLEYISLENPKAATTYVLGIERACQNLLFSQSAAAHTAIATAPWSSSTTLRSTGMTKMLKKLSSLPSLMDAAM